MNTERQRALEIAVQAAARELVDGLVTGMATCINCTHFDETNELCTKYSARPPARVIALGCPEYENLPF